MQQELKFSEAYKQRVLPANLGLETPESFQRRQELNSTRYGNSESYEDITGTYWGKGSGRGTPVSSPGTGALTPCDKKNAGSTGGTGGTKDLEEAQGVLNQTELPPRRYVSNFQQWADIEEVTVLEPQEVTVTDWEGVGRLTMREVRLGRQIDNENENKIDIDNENENENERCNHPGGYWGTPIPRFTPEDYQEYVELMIGGLEEDQGNIKALGEPKNIQLGKGKGPESEVQEDEYKNFIDQLQPWANGKGYSVQPKGLQDSVGETWEDSGLPPGYHWTKWSPQEWSGNLGVHPAVAADADGWVGRVDQVKHDADGWEEGTKYGERQVESDSEQDHDADGIRWEEWTKYGEDDAWYACKWLQQDGDEKGIPMQFTPCRYFRQARHSCGKHRNCKFSHNEIFHQRPFAAIRKSWGGWRPRRYYGGGYELKNESDW